MRKGTHRLLAFLLCGTMILSGLSSAAVYAEDEQAQNEIAEVQGEDTNAAQGEAEDITAKEETSEDAADASREQEPSVQEDNGEPASDGATPANASQKAVAMGNKIMPIALDDGMLNKLEECAKAYAKTNGTAARYDEQYSSFVGTGKTNVLSLNFGSSGGGPSNSDFRKMITDKRFEFTLTGPKGNIDLPDAQSTVTINKVFWEMDQKIETAGKGEYTLSMSDTENPEDGTKKFQFTVVAVKFNTDGKDKGTFDEGDDIEVTRHGMASSSLSYYTIPTVNKTGDADFIGWATKQGVTNYEGLHNGVVSKNTQSHEDNTYTFYAAYGTKKVSEVKFFDKDPDAQDAEPLDYWTHTLKFPETVQYGSSDLPTLDFWVKNTGTEDVKLIGLPSTTAITGVFNVEQSADEGAIVKKSEVNYLVTGKKIKFTLTPKVGLSRGTHTEKFYVRYGDSNSIMQIQAMVEVGVSTVYLKITDNIEKEYGVAKSTADVSDCEIYDATKKNKLSNIKLSDLKVTFTSGGFPDTADVKNEGYDITIQSDGNPDYEVYLHPDSTGKVIVKPATPTGVVSADTIVTGQTLSASALHGTFTNPHQGWEVTGKLTWDDVVNGQSASDIILSEGMHPYHWKFTPEGSHANNYKELTGETNVTATKKTLTDLHLKPGQTGTYTYYRNSKRHMEFIADREGKITVEYSPSGEDNWTTQEPTNAGIYDVRAKIDETGLYAAAEATAQLIINPQPITVQFNIMDKVYDGTTAVDPVEGLKYILSAYESLSGIDVNVDIESATFQSPNVGKQTVTVTVSELKGKDSGNYRLLSRTYTKNGTIIPAKIKAEIKNGKLTKTYGQSLAMTADQFTFTVTNAKKENIKIDDLPGIQFTSPGAAFDSDAGTYDVILSLVNGNCELENPTLADGLVVEKVTPVLRDGKVNVGSGKVDTWLEDVSLTGEFVNPYNSDLVASGEFKWKDTKAKLPNKAGDTTFDWIFELSTEAQKNYNPPAGGTATVTVLERDPIHIDAQPMTVPYDAKPHGIMATTKTENAILTYRYKRHLELAAIALSATWDDWANEEPVDAGTYDVEVTAMPDPSDTEHAASSVMTTLTITKATPDISGLKDTLTVPQGKVLTSEDAKGMGFPTDVNGKSLSGSYVWAVSDQAINDDGVVCEWGFVPEDTNNYNSVTGQVTVMLAPDERILDVQVYNLPDGDNYADYAVVKIACANGDSLQIGEIVTIYDTQNRPVGTATVTGSDVSQGYMQISLNADILGNEASMLKAYIETSKKHDGNTVQSPAELDILVDESVTAYTGGYTTNLLAELVQGYDKESIESVRFSVNEGDYIEVDQSGENPLAAVISGLQVGHAHINVEVTLKHPDPQKAAAGETITLIKRVHVDVKLPTGDLTVSKTVTGSGDKNREFNFTVTLDDTSISGQYGGMDFTDGVAAFTLKHGESLKAESLPAGVTYTVVEAEANKDGYTTTSSGTSDTIVPGEFAAAFTNHKEPEPGSPGLSKTSKGGKTTTKSPQTGDNNHIVMWSVLMITSLLCAVVTVMFSLRRRSRVRVMRRRRHR